MTSRLEVVGIILAAGQSSRMGSVKQMLSFKGKTILQRVIDNAVASSLGRVVVVLGYRADMIAPTIADKDVTVVINEDYESGQSSSIKAGLQALPDGTDAVLFMLGDQPLVAPGTINQVLDAYRISESPIVLPVFDGKRGNPVLFSRETFQRLNLLEGDSGARPLFEEYAGRIRQLPVDDSCIHFDVDTEEDYSRLLELDPLEREYCPLNIVRRS